MKKWNIRQAFIHLSILVFVSVSVSAFVLQNLKPGFHISRKDRKHMFANMYFELSRYSLITISL